MNMRFLLRNWFGLFKSLLVDFMSHRWSKDWRVQVIVKEVIITLLILFELESALFRNDFWLLHLIFKVRLFIICGIAFIKTDIFLLLLLIRMLLGCWHVFEFDWLFLFLYRLLHMIILNRFRLLFRNRLLAHRCWWGFKMFDFFRE